MNSVAAFLLLCNAGKTKPESSDIKKLLSTIDVEYDENTFKVLSEAIAEKSFEDVILEGKSKCGSSSASVSSSTETKVEETKEEEKEESDDDVDMDLFD